MISPQSIPPAWQAPGSTNQGRNPAHPTPAIEDPTPGAQGPGAVMGRLHRLNPLWIGVLARSISLLREGGKQGAAEHLMEAAAFWWKQLTGPPLRPPRRQP